MRRRNNGVTGKEKRIRRWEHEAVLDAMQTRLDAMPEAMDVRRCTVEHVFGTQRRVLIELTFGPPRG